LFLFLFSEEKKEPKKRSLGRGIALFPKLFNISEILLRLFSFQKRGKNPIRPAGSAF
jgi:hypothetical protein